jgi:hypothetical protein
MTLAIKLAVPPVQYRKHGRKGCHRRQPRFEDIVLDIDDTESPILLNLLSLSVPALAWRPISLLRTLITARHTKRRLAEQVRTVRRSDKTVANAALAFR